MIGYLAFWCEAAEGVLVAMFRGEPLRGRLRLRQRLRPEADAPWPLVDVHNAREAAWTKPRPAGDVVARLGFAHERLVELLNALADSSGPTRRSRVLDHREASIVGRNDSSHPARGGLKAYSAYGRAAADILHIRTLPSRLRPGNSRLGARTGEEAALHIPKWALILVTSLGAARHRLGLTHGRRRTPGERGQRQRACAGEQSCGTGTGTGTGPGPGTGAPATCRASCAGRHGDRATLRAARCGPGRAWCRPVQCRLRPPARRARRARRAPGSAHAGQLADAGVRARRGRSSGHLHAHLRHGRDNDRIERPGRRSARSTRAHRVVSSACGATTACQTVNRA